MKTLAEVYDFVKSQGHDAIARVPTVDEVLEGFALAIQELAQTAKKSKDPMVGLAVTLLLKSLQMRALQIMQEFVEGKRQLTEMTEQDAATILASIVAEDKPSVATAEV